MDIKINEMLVSGYRRAFRAMLREGIHEMERIKFKYERSEYTSEIIFFITISKYFIEFMRKNVPFCLAFKR